MAPLFYMCRNMRRGDGLWKGGEGGGLLSGIGNCGREERFSGISENVLIF